MVEYRINTWFGVVPPTSIGALAGGRVVFWVRPVFRTDQSDDCGSNPHLGVTVHNFLLLFLGQKALPILKVQELSVSSSSPAVHDVKSSSLVHDD